MESELRGLLYSAIDQFASTKAMEVSYPNVADTEITIADRFLKVSVIPVPPDTQGIKSGWSVYQWLFQVSVYVRETIGEIKPLNIADALRQEFPFNFKFKGAEHEFTVTRPASVAPPVQDGGWYFVPVTFRLMAIS